MFKFKNLTKHHTYSLIDCHNFIVKPLNKWNGKNLSKLNIILNQAILSLNQNI